MISFQFGLPNFWNFIETVKIQIEQFILFNISDQLKRHYNLKQFWLEVDLDDVSSYDENLAEKLLKQPSEHLPLVNMLLFC